jgi:hypothetical protein
MNGSFLVLDVYEVRLRLRPISVNRPTPGYVRFQHLFLARGWLECGAKQTIPTLHLYAMYKVSIGTIIAILDPEKL